MTKNKSEGRRYYAGMHALDRSFVYGRDEGWTVYVFDSADLRDEWVHEQEASDNRRGLSPRSEAISRQTARMITGSWTKEVAIAPGLTALQPSHTTVNPRYWG